MITDPGDLAQHLDLLEGIERASLRMIVQALLEAGEDVSRVFSEEVDFQRIAEDVTRDALDRVMDSKIPGRLRGAVDYKRPRYVFLPDHAVRQALFVDSKAEQVSGAGTATIQTSQTSMRIRQRRGGQTVDVPGELPVVYERAGTRFLTTTVLVKYNYEEPQASRPARLDHMVVACIPNGMLQDKYNPDPSEGIWLAGRNAPSRGEAFRVRLSFARLSRIAAWRVQRVYQESSFSWLS